VPAEVGRRRADREVMSVQRRCLRLCRGAGENWEKGAPAAGCWSRVEDFGVEKTFEGRPLLRFAD
jgi:hypothetical protein